ncbi:MAG: hypothetical protein K0S21_3523, partial [Rhizobiaceae bacterium]|nr:hypothetical protein [Rhizobiaceae bacterium]
PPDGLSGVMTVIFTNAFRCMRFHTGIDLIFPDFSSPPPTLPGGGLANRNKWDFGLFCPQEGRRLRENTTWTQ